jgi:diguanylate cyclase (GGDEF)-like protein
MEYRMRTLDGRTVWLRDYVSCVNGGAGFHLRGTMVDITERKQLEQELFESILRDSLTGLPNRTSFLERLDQVFKRNRRLRSGRFGVLFLDLDRFKFLNDSLGHLAGDQLLLKIAVRLKECLRESDTVARMSGDEFAVLLEDVQEPDLALAMADRIQSHLASPVQIGEREIFPSASIGVALSRQDYRSAKDVLRDADTAMYHAKRRGGARAVVFDSAMHAQALAALDLEAELRRALDRGEFQLFYQPIVALADRTLSGFEALLRWRHPARGLLRPAEFLSLAEETGLIVPIGWWVLGEACRQMGLWSKMPFAGQLSISVNLAGRQFSQPDLVGRLDETLRESGLDPSRLKLEFTETVLTEHSALVASRLWQLERLGVRVMLDDFGTGYSSLSRLWHFPIHTLKIDRNFIESLCERRAEFVRTIIALARNLKMDTIAEGVETEDQMAQLRLLGCDYGQGYLFSRAVDAAAATEIIRSRGQAKTTCGSSTA